MKTLALISLILSGLLMIPVGFGTVITFLMSFDAPGSETDLKQWAARIGIIVFAVVMAGLVYFGYQAYQVGNYQRTILFTAPVILAFIGFIAWAYLGS